MNSIREKELLNEAFAEVTNDKSKTFKTQKAIKKEMVSYLHIEDSTIMQYISEQVEKEHVLVEAAYAVATEDKNRHFSTQKAIEDEMVRFLNTENAKVNQARIEDYIQKKVHEYEEEKKKNKTK